MSCSKGRSRPRGLARSRPARSATRLNLVPRLSSRHRARSRGATSRTTRATTSARRRSSTPCARCDDPRVANEQQRVTAPFAGTVIAIAPARDEAIRAGTAVVVLEAMKMEHEVVADSDGFLRQLNVAVGDTVEEGQLLAL